VGVEIDNSLILKGNSPTLTINASSKLSVLAGRALTVEGNFVNNGELHLKSPTNSGAAGSLITMQSGAVVSGTAFAERFIPISEWHYVSSPISNAKSNLFTTSPNGWNPNFFAYNEGANITPDPANADYASWASLTNAWTYAHNGQAGAAADLSVGKGYATFDNGYKTVTFEGTFNNGDISIPVTYTANDANAGYFDGWNLIGNPFPSAIDWNASGWDKTKIDNTLYFYEEDHTTGLKRYWYYNGAGGTVTDLAGVSLNSTSLTPQIIPSAQGFFVKANASGDVVIPNSARTHSQQIFWKGKTLPTNFLRLRVDGNKLSDELIVRFIDDATEKPDSKYDAYKMQSQGDKLPQIYSFGSAVPLAINTLPFEKQTSIVPLGMSCQTAGNYSISASEIFFDESQEVYLVDKMQTVGNGEFLTVNLREKPTYEFYFDGGNTTNRFEIHFFNENYTGINTINELLFEVFAYKNELVVNLQQKDLNQANVIIYNLLGTKVFEQKLFENGTHRLPLTLVSGVYVVKVETAQTSQSKRIYIE
jgi:hypothetical protein